jgi:hypothetical protein
MHTTCNAGDGRKPFHDVPYNERPNLPGIGLEDIQGISKVRDPRGWTGLYVSEYRKCAVAERKYGEFLASKRCLPDRFHAHNIGLVGLVSPVNITFPYLHTKFNEKRNKRCQ